MRVRDAAAMLADTDLGSLGAMRWLDLGAGEGTFTLALAEQLAAGSTIHAVDRDRSALAAIPARHHDVTITTEAADFTDVGRLPAADGILLANSLHYVPDQPAFLRACERRLARQPRFLIVEYDSESGNRWVPYPVSRRRLHALFEGYVVTSLGRRPSRYQRAELYAAYAVGDLVPR